MAAPRVRASSSMNALTLPLTKAQALSNILDHPFQFILPHSRAPRTSSDYVENAAEQWRSDASGSLAVDAGKPDVSGSPPNACARRPCGVYGVGGLPAKLYTTLAPQNGKAGSSFGTQADGKCQGRGRPRLKRGDFATTRHAYGAHILCTRRRRRVGLTDLHCEDQEQPDHAYHIAYPAHAYAAFGTLPRGERRDIHSIGSGASVIQTGACMSRIPITALA